MDFTGECQEPTSTLKGEIWGPACHGDRLLCLEQYSIDCVEARGLLNMNDIGQSAEVFEYGIAKRVTFEGGETVSGQQ